MGCVMLVRDVLYFTKCPRLDYINICIRVRYDVTDDPNMNIGRFWKYECDVEDAWKAFLSSKKKQPIPLSCLERICKFHFPEIWDFSKGELFSEDDVTQE